MNLDHMPGTADALLAMLEQPCRRPAGTVPRVAEACTTSGGGQLTVALVAGNPHTVGCVFCALCDSQRPSQAELGHATIAWRDENLMALVVGGRPGVLLVPRQHMSHLDPSPSSAILLATLRRVVQAVESWYHVSVRVESVVEGGSAPGHVCFWAAPTSVGTDPFTVPEGTADAMTRSIGEHLFPLSSV